MHPGDPAYLEKGKRGRLFLAIVISCALHAAALTITIGERSPPIFSSGRTAPTPVTITARLISAAPPLRGKPSENTETISLKVSSEPPLDVAAPKPLAEADGLLPLPGPVYYTSDQLTKRPKAIEVPELNSPSTLPFIVSGKLILQLWIDSGGKVVDVVVEESNLPEVFADTARDAFLHSRFSPGERNGVPVGTLMRIEVSYDDMRLPKQ